MKKKIIFLLIFLILIGGLLFGYCSLKKDKKQKEELKQERYNEIRENAKKAVEWNIRAMYPDCVLSDNFREGSGSFYNSSFLINNGYIKKSELLDVDNKSYCDVYVDINPYYEDPLDHQHNCEVAYKIYLKCKDFEDEGYINWG